MKYLSTPTHLELVGERRSYHGHLYSTVHAYRIRGIQFGELVVQKWPVENFANTFEITDSGLYQVVEMTEERDPTTQRAVMSTFISYIQVSKTNGQWTATRLLRLRVEELLKTASWRTQWRLLRIPPVARISLADREIYQHRWDNWRHDRHRAWETLDQRMASQ